MSEFDKKFNGQIEVIENRKAKVLIIIVITVGILLGLIRIYFVVCPEAATYADAAVKMNLGKYDEAENEIVEYFKTNGFDSNLQNLQMECMYREASKLFKDGKNSETEYSEAERIFKIFIYNTDAYDKAHEYAYKLACGLMDDGQYRQAIIKFKELEDYNDSKEKIDECKAILKENSKSIDEASVGDIVFFGNYEGEEEWIVLRKEGHRCLLLSLNIIACRPFGGKTWENSTMRTWLNDTYLNTAFSEKEKNAIIEKDIITLDNEEYGTEGGDDTADKVFLLSVYEANAYLPSIPEEYLESSYEVDEGDYAGCIVDSWWLRSPGFEDNWFYCETGTGSACEVNATDHYGVRPAIWVNASKL